MRSTRFLLATTLFAFAACSDSVAPNERIAGAYALVTINGQALPYTLVQSGQSFRIEVTEGALVLDSNGTFSESLVIQQTDSLVVSKSVSEVRGSWSALRQLQLVVDGTVLEGAIVGNTITTNDGEYTMVYRRSSDSGRPRP